MCKKLAICKYKVFQKQGGSGIELLLSRSQSMTGLRGPGAVTVFSVFCRVLILWLSVAPSCQCSGPSDSWQCSFSICFPISVGNVQISSHLQPVNIWIITLKFSQSRRGQVTSYSFWTENVQVTMIPGNLVISRYLLIFLSRGSCHLLYLWLQVIMSSHSDPYHPNIQLLLSKIGNKTHKFQENSIKTLVGCI